MLRNVDAEVAAEENTPLANLWTNVLRDAGALLDRFADASATATGIWSSA